MIRCLLFGHKPLQLNMMQGKPLIHLGDMTGWLVEVQMCERCHLVYWQVVPHAPYVPLDIREEQPTA